MKAMILAAGKGDRLRPGPGLTPQPWISAGSVPVLESHMRALAAAGFT